MKLKSRSLFAAATIGIASLLTSSAYAAQITQNLQAVESFGDFTPYDIKGNPFDPALGTLTSVMATLYGTYTPGDYYAFGPSPGTIVTNFFTDLGSSFPSIAGSQTVTPSVGCTSSQTSSGCIYTGVPIFFSISPVVTAPLSDFISSTPGQIVLADFGFNSRVAGGAGGGSDNTTFVGTLQLTYNYGVPEPAGFALFLSGVAALLFLRRRAV